MRNTIATFFLLVSIASAQTLESWTVDTDKAVPKPLVIRRGETRDLRVTFKNYSAAAAIPTNASVQLWYRSADISNGLYYVITGSVHSASAGVARVVWTAANCGTATNYTWDLVVLSNTTPYNLRAFGTIQLQAGVYSQATTATNPATYLALDWAHIINVNTSSAPFMTLEGVVTNGGATVDGQVISNGAVIVTSGGSSNAWHNPASATNWTWTSDGTQITLTGYTGPNDVVIPDVLDGLPVTTTTYALFEHSSITSISGGKNLTTIAAATCYDCQSLLSVELHEITYVGDSAFSQCYVLTNVSFSGNEPASGGGNVYGLSYAVKTYVTNPQATGWGATWRFRPVVRLPVYADEFWRLGTNLTTLLAEKISANGNGSSLTGITAAQVGAVATNDARYLAGVTNGGATINGSPLTNGASFAITGGGGGGGISNIVVAGVGGTLTGSGSNVLASVSLASLAGAGILTNGRASVSFGGVTTINPAGYGIDVERTGIASNAAGDASILVGAANGAMADGFGIGAAVYGQSLGGTQKSAGRVLFTRNGSDTDWKGLLQSMSGGGLKSSLVFQGYTTTVGDAAAGSDSKLIVTAGAGGDKTATLQMGTTTRDWAQVVDPSPYAMRWNYIGTDAPKSNVVIMNKGGSVQIDGFTSGSSLTNSQLIFDGDSLTVSSYGTQPYTSNVVTTVLFNRYNVATAGYQLSQMISDAPVKVDAKRSNLAPFNVVVVWGGVNDLAYGASAQEAFGRLEAYCNTRRTRGHKVIALTMTASEAYDSGKATFNALVRANWPRFADGLADVGAIPQIGADGSWTNTTYFYSDKLHLVDAGYNLVASNVSAAIQTLTLSNITTKINLAVTGGVRIEGATTNVGPLVALGGGNVLTNGGARLVAGADIGLSSTILSNGATITISYTGAVSAADCTNIVQAALARFSTTNSIPVTNSTTFSIGVPASSVCLDDVRVYATTPGTYSKRYALRLFRSADFRRTHLAYTFTNGLIYATTTTVAQAVGAVTNVVPDASGIVWPIDMYWQNAGGTTNDYVSFTNATATVLWNCCTNTIAMPVGSLISHVEQLGSFNFWGGTNLYGDIVPTTGWTGTVQIVIDGARK